jgi:FkbM family methyltransferase
VRSLDNFVCAGDHTLFGPGLGPGANVIDLGANRGGFRDALARLIPDATFHGIEANESLIPELRRQPYRSVAHYAVAGHDGPLTFHVAEQDMASSLLPLERSTLAGASVEVTVEGRSLEPLLRDYPGQLDIVKIDIEGAEVPALRSLSPETLGRIGQLSVEFHHADEFGLGLKRESKSVIRHIQRQGFVVLRFRERDRDVVMLNRARFSVTVAEEAWWRLLLTGRRWRGRLVSLRERGVLRTFSGRLRARIRPIGMDL